MRVPGGARSPDGVRQGREVPVRRALERLAPRQGHGSRRGRVAANGHAGLSVTPEHENSLWEQPPAALRCRGANSDAGFPAQSVAAEAAPTGSRPDLQG
jgi:hypothetical protein